MGSYGIFMSNLVNIDSYILLRNTSYLKYYTCIFIGSFFLDYVSVLCTIHTHI